MSDTGPSAADKFTKQLINFIAIIGLLLFVLWAGIWAVQKYDIQPADNAVLGFLAISGIIMAFAGAILWKIINGDIALYGIIAEPAPKDENGKPLRGEDGAPMNTGKASLARFQFLLFTFVVAGLFLMLSIEVGQFVNIPANVLGLMGISGGSFVLSKAIGGQGEAPPPPASDSAAKK